MSNEAAFPGDVLGVCFPRGYVKFLRVCHFTVQLTQQYSTLLLKDISGFGAIEVRGTFGGMGGVVEGILFLEQSADLCFMRLFQQVEHHSQ